MRCTVVSDLSSLLREAGSPRTHDAIRLPVEVYPLILDHIRYDPYDTTLAEYKSTLSKLCLVCHVFLEECQPRLFRYLEFACSVELKTAHWKKIVALPRLAWLGALTSGHTTRAAYLASFVQECSFHEWSSGDAPPGTMLHPARYLRTYIAIATCCSNLRCVKLADCSLDNKVILSLAEMPNLQDVSFDECQIDDLGVPPFEPRCRWTRLTTALTDFMISSSYLAALARFIDLDQLEHLATDFLDILSSIVNRSAPLLRSLEASLFSDEMLLFFAHLDYMPNITSLTIWSCDEIMAPFQVSSHLVPRLAELTATPAIAASIVPGRPLKRVTLSPTTPLLDQMAAEHIHALHASATPIQELGIPHFGILLELNPEDFPALHSVILPHDAPAVPVSCRYSCYNESKY